LAAFREILMALLSFRKSGCGPAEAPLAHGDIPALIEDYSIEVMPRTAAKVEDFRALLPAGTRVYIAHIDGTEIDDMVATARRLRDEGFEPMPHFPARSIPGPATLADWIRRYQAEAGVKQGLLLGGGIATPRGEYHSSMQLLESGFFDDAGFTHLHVAGHPEGNRDIDPDGGEAEVMAALRWKQDFANRTDASFRHRHAIRLRGKRCGGLGRAAGGRGHRDAGASGRGGSREAADAHQVRHRLRRGQVAGRPAETGEGCHQAPSALRADGLHGRSGRAQGRGQATNIERIHFFPLGGIKANAEWAMTHGGAAAQPAAAASVA
jgi:methylenetetrahydrofolate reductase (NADPH)